MHWRRKWQPTLVFLPGESQGRGSLVGCRLWGRTESDTTEATQQQQHSWKHRHTVGYYVNYLVAFSQLKVIPEVHNLLYHWDGKFLHR